MYKNNYNFITSHIPSRQQQCAKYLYYYYYFKTPTRSIPRERFWFFHFYDNLPFFVPTKIFPSPPMRVALRKYTKDTNLDVLVGDLPNYISFFFLIFSKLAALINRLLPTPLFLIVYLRTLHPLLYFCTFLVFFENYDLGLWLRYSILKRNSANAFD